MDLMETLVNDKNVGGLDRALRLVIGVICLAGAALLQADILIRAVLAIIGLAGLGTGALSHCTLYSLLGISTAEKKKR